MNFRKFMDVSGWGHFWVRPLKWRFFRAIICSIFGTTAQKSYYLTLIGAQSDAIG